MHSRFSDHKEIKAYRKVLRISLPLVISMSSTMIMEFTDRVFLANYSLDAIAAALPAGITAFLLISFFLGTAQYLNVFVAQYSGSGRPQRVGAVLWQGIYFSVLSGVALAGLSFLAEPLFRLGGHPIEVQVLEAVYFKVLCRGSGILIVGTALSCFFSGRGQTRLVMIITMIGTLFNIPLDYALINGIWIFPEWGIRGAAIATVMSWSLVTLIFALLVFTRENDRAFNVLTQRTVEADLFGRLMRYGIPSAIQFSLDIFAFTFFIFMVGRIGKIQLAATNMVFSINSLAFMPMMGFSLGTSTLVGQALGRNRVNDAVAVTKATIHIVLGYIFILLILFLFLPQPLLELFRPRHLAPENFAPIVSIGIILLRFVAAYIFFDALYMVCIGVLKGAGDTRFIMCSIGALSLAIMILPVYIGVEVFGAGLYYAWSCATAFVFFLFTVSFWRYRQGHWKNVRVIEHAPTTSVH
ncbi:MAG: MATE family efflux transporter [Desulfobacterales bacterium]|nr:MATE family efflux transporter [Desulfobacterales bacterium]